LGGPSRRGIRCSPLSDHSIQALAPAEEDYYQQDWREDLASGARDQLDGLQQSIGTKAEQLVVAGDVPHTVCAQAEELGADVLVIGRSSESGCSAACELTHTQSFGGRTARWSVFEFAFGRRNYVSAQEDLVSR
jgi:nucleotide-binding universal stress UspA family protein